MHRKVLVPVTPGQTIVNKCLISIFERHHCGERFVTRYFADLCGLSWSLSQAPFGVGLPFQNDLDRIGRCRRRFEFTYLLLLIFGLRALERFGSLAEFARLNLIASVSGSKKAGGRAKACCHGCPMPVALSLSLSLSLKVLPFRPLPVSLLPTYSFSCILDPGTLAWHVSCSGFFLSFHSRLSQHQIFSISESELVYKKSELNLIVF